MAFGSVTLLPGVNVERTPTLLQAGISASQLIRFKDSLVQKYGGWQKYFNLALNGVPRDLHVWEDLTQTQHLLIGTTTTLYVLTDGALAQITPQTLVSDFTPNFSTVMNSSTVTVVDSNINNVTVYDSVFFDTPISVGGIVLSGVYPISVTLGGNSYEIVAPNNATSTVNNGGVVPQFTTTLGSANVKVTLPDHGVTASGAGNIAVFAVSTTGNGVTISGDYTVASIIDGNNFNITAANQATASGAFYMNSSSGNPFTPANTAPAITLSDNNYVATNTAAVWINAGVGFSCPSTGKWYWEYKFRAGSNQDFFIGMSTVNPAAAYILGTFTDSWGMRSAPNNDVLADGCTAVYSSGNGTWAIGDTLGVAFDAVGGYVYVHHNGVYLNSGAPVSGTGYVFSGVTGGNWLAGCSLNNASAPSAQLIDGIGSAFSYSPPSGFSPLGIIPEAYGDAQLTYYFNLGPPPVGIGYGVGGYGLGGYGLGQATSSQQTGTPINAADWTSANWGEIAIACPQNGGIYQWDPTSGFTNAGLIATAPPINGGIFVSTTEQILVAWGSSIAEQLGISQDPLLVQWSNEGDYTNWIPTAADQAGNFRIPIGSKIMGGMPTPTQNLIWTDLDCWAMNYLGPPLVFGFNQIGAGAGAISSHAMIQLRGNVYWMGQSNFYVYAGGGVVVLPCSVWDFVFQNLNTAYSQNVRAMPNTNFNEVGWLFPSNASVNGECDCYVKMNVTEPNNPWDYGPSGALPRSAWTDQSVLGPPLSTSPSGLIYQQETTMDADGSPLMYSFTTGYFFLAEGEDFVFVDQIYPDFVWGFYGQTQTATVMLTFNITNYPGDTPISYGPYSVTQATEYVSVRFRGRQMSITVAGNDLGSFTRLGRVRYRWSPAGRR